MRRSPRSLDGEPVWFGCDVGKMMRRDLGIWDEDLFDYGGVYDADLRLWTRPPGSTSTRRR